MLSHTRTMHRLVALSVIIALLLSVFATMPRTALAGDGIFVPHPTTPAFGDPGGWTQAVALGDMDGDGDLDAVVANLFVEQNTILLNDGAGNFAPHPTTPTFGITLATDIALADLNGDDHLDVFIVVSARSQVFLNDGNGNLKQVPNAGPFIIGVGTAVALGDLDDDDDIDAVVTYLGDVPTHVLRNNGSGTFSIVSTIPTTDAIDVALGDIDDDGTLDAVIAGFEGGAQTVWLGNDDGTFSAHPTTPSFGAGNSRALAMGDIDGDGDLDVVVANDDDEAQTVWLNDGVGNFSAHPVTPTFGSGYSWDVALADIDGDGDLDAVVANSESQGETVWLNDGNGNFTAHPTTPSFGAGDSTALAIGDIDGDGDPDVVVANFGQPIVGLGEQTVWLNMDNSPPVADAGGPYTVIQGESVVLDGTASYDPDPGDSLTFEWDLDGDGVFGETGVDAEHGDEVGSMPTFQAGDLTGPDTWIVTLRVTDVFGATDEDQATIVIEAYAQGCLYAGSLSQVSPLDVGSTPNVTCGRGTPVSMLQGEDIWACLYAGSLTQVGFTEPLNCGRGEPIGFAEGTDLLGCLYAGRLSQVGYTKPSSCGRGEQIGLEAWIPS